MRRIPLWLYTCVRLKAPYMKHYNNTQPSLIIHYISHSIFEYMRYPGNIVSPRNRPETRSLGCTGQRCQPVWRRRPVLSVKGWPEWSFVRKSLPRCLACWGKLLSAPSTWPRNPDRSESGTTREHQHTRELISARKMSHKHNNKDLSRLGWLLTGMRVNTRYIKSTRGACSWTCARR